MQALSLFCIFFYFTIVASQTCTVQEITERGKKTIQHAEIVCRNVQSNLLIHDFYFLNKTYPQDLIITESTIPTLSNYSSLLNMRHIRKLFLKGVGIKHILPGAFRNMETLEELDLGNNELSEIQDGAFTGLINVKKLFLVGNNITTEPQNAFKDLPKLEELDISGNPIKEISPEKFVSDTLVITRS